MQNADDIIRLDGASSHDRPPIRWVMQAVAALQRQQG